MVLHAGWARGAEVHTGTLGSDLRCRASPHMGSPRAFPQLKRALQGERSPCPRLLPPRSQRLSGSCSEAPSSPHPTPWGSLPRTKSRPGKQTGKVSLLWWLFSCCLQRRCGCSAGAGARHHSHPRVPRVPLTSPTDPGLPIIVGSLLVWGHRSPQPSPWHPTLTGR